MAHIVVRGQFGWQSEPEPILVERKPHQRWIMNHFAKTIQAKGEGERGNANESSPIGGLKEQNKRTTNEMADGSGHSIASKVPRNSVQNSVLFLFKGWFRISVFSYKDFKKKFYFFRFSSNGRVFLGFYRVFLDVTTVNWFELSFTRLNWVSLIFLE